MVHICVGNGKDMVIKMDNIYDNNIKALTDRFSTIKKETLDKYLDEESKVRLEKSRSGIYIPVIKIHDKDIWLNSKYRAKAEAEQWAQSNKKAENMATMIMFGLGNALLVEEVLSSNIDTSNIIVFEPNPCLFLNVLKNIDLVGLIKNARFHIVVKGINDTDLMHLLFHLVDYSNISNTIHLTHPYYDEIYINEYKAFLQEVRDNFSLNIIRTNSELKYANDMQKNIKYNMRYIPYCQGIAQYKNIIAGGVPVIIVSAGPSLNKNILELKRAKNKSVILATDTAVRALLSKNIIPDMIMSIDPRKSIAMYIKKESSDEISSWNRYITSLKEEGKDASLAVQECWGNEEIYIDVCDERVMNIPLICGVTTRNIIATRNVKQKIIFDTGLGVEKSLFKLCNKEIMSMESGGSVANDLFSFALLMGAKTIIFVGQDLAYTGGEKHAKGIYVNQDNKVDEEYRFKVEDIHGDMIPSREDYYQYLLWFNNRIARLSSDYKIIDATEGGAKIKGTEIITLKEAIDRECMVEYNVQKSIQELGDAFTTEEKERLLKYIKDTPQRLKEIKSKAQEGIECNKKLMKAVKMNKYETSGTAKIIKKLTKINNFIDNSADMSHISQYMKNIEIEVNREVHNINEDLRTEVEDVSGRQIKLMEGIVKSVDKMLPDIEEMIKLTERQDDIFNGRIELKANSIEIDGI